MAKEKHLETKLVHSSFTLSHLHHHLLHSPFRLNHPSFPSSSLPIHSHSHSPLIQLALIIMFDLDRFILFLSVFLLQSLQPLSIQLHAGVQLNEDSFDSAIQHGLWFIESYSPFCPHCKRFAPTWIDLVDKMKPSEIDGLNMGQIDCIAQGDLCIKLSVEFYPQMKLFEDGKFIESYSGEKTIEAISSYLKVKTEAYRLKHLSTDTSPAIPSPPTQSQDHSSVPTDSSSPITDIPPTDHASYQAQEKPHQPDPSSPPVTKFAPSLVGHAPTNDGKVILLTSKNWESFTHHAYNQFPTFIKYYTAWCKECRNLSPVWAEVAAQLKNVVNVAEFDCDAPWNKEICRKMRIDQFPTFVLYNAGSKLAYSGPRTVAEMTHFARTVSADPGTHEVTLTELREAVQTDPVVFLFLHSSSTSLEVMHAVTSAGKSLAGSAKILKTDLDDVYDKLMIPRGDPYLVVFKGHEPTAWAKIALAQIDPKLEPSELHRTGKLAVAVKHWLAVHSIPIMAELNDSNFHRILSSGVEKLVVIACLSGISSGPRGINVEHSNEKSIQLKDDMKTWAQQWRKSQDARGVDTLVDWVWINGDVWSDWLYNSFGVNLPRPADDPKESSSIIITDAFKHVYYDSQENGLEIMFKPTSVFQTLLAIEMNKLSGKLSGTFMGRMKWRFRKLKHFLGFMFQIHWVIFWVILIAIIAISVKTWKVPSTVHAASGMRSGSPGAGGYSKSGVYNHNFHSSGLSSATTINNGSNFGSPEHSNNSKGAGFGHVFGLNSNVSPLKAD